ncbi:MAG: hypothetical protein PWQ82_648 [Thermosediminibacterales bacterium]|nr:hypothetical protein [Thermosediminibacterales bacterium]
MKERIVSKVLDNGLSVFLMRKKGYNKKFAIYATHYGSIDNEFVIPGEEKPIKVPDGIAHFLEHKLFEEEYGSVMDRFAEQGASSNAYTNYTTTAYLFSCTDRFYENLDLLIDFVQKPYFTKENVEKEKGIIEQEIRMYLDDPGWRVFMNLLKALYHKHPVRIDIAGSVESIRQIDMDTLYKCYETFYNPENMVLFAVGDFDEAEALNKIESNFKKRKYEVHGKIKRFYPEEPKEIYKTKIVENLSVSEPLFHMGFKDTDVGYDGSKLLKKDITTRILLDMILGRSSKLYRQLYEEGLIDDRFSLDYEGQKDYGFCVIGGPTRDPEMLHDRILKGLEEYKVKGLNKEDYERNKKKMIGNYIKGFNSPEFIATTFISYHFKNINILQYLEYLNIITFKDVEERFSSFLDPKYHSYSVILPDEK